jgi:hypothetical protein
MSSSHVWTHGVNNKTLKSGFSIGSRAIALLGKFGKYESSFNTIVTRIKDSHLKMHQSLRRKMENTDVFVNETLKGKHLNTGCTPLGFPQLPFPVAAPHS